MDVFAWGLNFGHPESIAVVPPKHIGQAEPKKGWFRSAKPLIQNFADVAKHEHPMAVNMLAGLQQQLKEDPSLVHQTDDRGFTFLHGLTLAGSPSSVKALIEHGSDPNAVTRNGMTPLRLAKVLGWKQVAKVLTEGGATQ